MDWFRDWFSRRPPIEVQGHAAGRIGQLRSSACSCSHNEEQTTDALVPPLAFSSAKLEKPAAAGLSRPAMLILLAVAVVAIAIAGVGWWRIRQSPDNIPVEVKAAQSPTTVELVVSVAGQVQKPGIVRLPRGSRVVDAIEAAGGLLPDAQTGVLNLARPLRDGEMIIVGVPADASEEENAAGGLINLNTASAEQLQTLPGVGTVLAQNILDYRRKHGSFSSVDELANVDGIGDTRMNRLRDLVTV